MAAIEGAVSFATSASSSSNIPENSNHSGGETCITGDKVVTRATGLDEGTLSDTTTTADQGLKPHLVWPTIIRKDGGSRRFPLCLLKDNSMKSAAYNISREAVSCFPTLLSRFDELTDIEKEGLIDTYQKSWFMNRLTETAGELGISRSIKLASREEATKMVVSLSSQVLEGEGITMQDCILECDFKLSDRHAKLYMKE